MVACESIYFLTSKRDQVTFTGLDLGGLVIAQEPKTEYFEETMDEIGGIQDWIRRVMQYPSSYCCNSCHHFLPFICFLSVLSSIRHYE